MLFSTSTDDLEMKEIKLHMIVLSGCNGKKNKTVNKHFMKIPYTDIKIQIQIDYI